MAKTSDLILYGGLALAGVYILGRIQGAANPLQGVSDFLGDVVGGIGGLFGVGGSTTSPPQAGIVALLKEQGLVSEAGYFGQPYAINTPNTAIPVGDIRAGSVVNQPPIIGSALGIGTPLGIEAPALISYTQAMSNSGSSSVSRGAPTPSQKATPIVGSAIGKGTPLGIQSIEQIKAKKTGPLVSYQIKGLPAITKGFFP